MEIKKSDNFVNDKFGALTVITNDKNEIFFIGKEVCEKLAYSNVSKAISDHVKEKHKIELNNESLSSLGIDLGQRGGVLISEAGFYSLVMRSKLENAEAFQDWVTEDVLPSIRKNGSFKQKPMNQLEMISFIALQLNEQNQRTEQLEKKVLEIESKQTTIDTNFYTISGYANLHKLKVDTQEANRLGRIASKTSRELQYPTGKAFDSKYGEIKTYHVDILKMTFKN
jgi:prophage antirepressor-like protein